MPCVTVRACVPLVHGCLNMMESPKDLPSYHSLQSTRRVVWAWAFGLAAFLLLWQWPGITMAPLRHTFLLSLPSPGTLISDFWGREHFFSLFMMFMWAVPLTAGFASDSSFVAWRRIAHLIVVFVLWLLSLAMMFFWAFDYHTANYQSAGNALNPFNDDRWCCVNFALAPEVCNPVAALHLCNPSPGQADLIVRPIQAWRFWFLVVWMALLIVDFFVIIKGLLERAVSRHRRDVRRLYGLPSSDEDGDAEAEGEEEEEEMAQPSQPQQKAGTFSFRVPVPGTNAPPQCPVPAKDQLRALAVRQQQLVTAAAQQQMGRKYQGKIPSKR